MILLLIHLYCWECQNLLRRHESATLVGWLRRHSQCLFGKSVALNNFWSSCWSGFCWISMDFLGFQPIWSAFSMGIVCHGPWYFGLGFLLRNSLEQHCPSVAWWLMRSTERCSIPTSMRRCATWGNRFSPSCHHVVAVGVFFLDVLFFMFIPGKKTSPHLTCRNSPRQGRAVIHLGGGVRDMESQKGNTWWYENIRNPMPGRHRHGPGLGFWNFVSIFLR